MKKIFILLVIAFVLLCFSSVFSQTNQSPKQISMGVVNGKAISLPKPIYPASARALNLSGAVNVQVLIDANGAVESAKAVSGHPLLRNASVDAAKQAKFQPVLLSGQPVKVSGVIVYNFIGVKDWMSIGSEFGYAKLQGLRRSIELPDDFSDEYELLKQLSKESIADQKAQLPNITALVKTKLSDNDRWLFEYGMAKTALLDSLNKNDEDTILSNLAKFRELSANIPSFGVISLMNRASKLAEFADKKTLTQEDRETIFYYVK